MLRRRRRGNCGDVTELLLLLLLVSDECLR